MRTTQVPRRCANAILVLKGTHLQALVLLVLGAPGGEVLQGQVELIHGAVKVLEERNQQAVAQNIPHSHLRTSRAAF